MPRRARAARPHYRFLPLPGFGLPGHAFHPPADRPEPPPAFGTCPGGPCRAAPARAAGGCRPGRAAIAAARRQGDALQILAALTQALPDDTWLADLSLKPGNLTMDGQSADAAKLIALLAAVPGLQDPSFTAPVTRTNDGKADLFSLRVGVAK